MTESSRRSRSLTPFICAALALGAIAPGAVRAQTPSPVPAREYVLLGVGIRSRPAYDGSASQVATPFPTLRYYGRPWFARTTQGILEGGVRRELSPGLAFGAQVAYEAGRRATESSLLDAHRVPDIGPWASVGVHLELDRKFGAMPVNLLGRVRQFTSLDRGAQADVRLSVGVYGSTRAQAGVFVQAAWANAKSTRAYYGVTPQASALTGLPAFAPGGGPLSTGAGALGLIQLRPHWSVGWSLEGRHLQGDAVRSPLTERISNYYANASLAYRF